MSRPSGFRRNSEWPRWSEGPPSGGSWKESPEDFFVEELPAVLPTGAGEHQWLRIEKVGRSTGEVAERLAHLAGVDVSAVGYAGLKDRDARTIQDFSVQGGREVVDLGSPDVRVLAVSRNPRKLRNGQLRGNRFTLRIRGGDVALARERADELRFGGMPNYYGEQRFASGAADLGRSLLGGARPRIGFPQVKFALSAWQALLFNRVLFRRGARRLPGDLILDDPRPDEPEDAGVSDRLRLAVPGDRGVPTGPMYGHELRWPEGEARALEERVLAEERLAPGDLRRFPDLTRGTRRRLWVPVDPQIEASVDGFWLRVELPAGSYATVLLEEIL